MAVKAGSSVIAEHIKSVQQENDVATQQMCSSQASSFLPEPTALQKTPMCVEYVGEYNGLRITEEERRQLFGMFMEHKASEYARQDAKERASLERENAELARELIADLERRLTLSQSKLEELKQFDDRDRLFFSDAWKQIISKDFCPQLPTMRLLSTDSSVSVIGTQNSSSSAYSETVNCQDLFQEIVGHRIKYDQGTQGAKAQMSYGLRASAEFKRRYGVEPIKRRQFIDGCVRKVNNYAMEDKPWLKEIAVTVLSELGLVELGDKVC